MFGAITHNITNFLFPLNFDSLHLSHTIHNDRFRSGREKIRSRSPYFSHNNHMELHVFPFFDPLVTWDNLTVGLNQFEFIVFDDSFCVDAYTDVLFSAFFDINTTNWPAPFVCRHSTHMIDIIWGRKHAPIDNFCLYLHCFCVPPMPYLYVPTHSSEPIHIHCHLFAPIYILIDIIMYIY